MFGISLTFNFILIFIIFLLYKRLGKKVTNKDIENYILQNFLEVEDL